jgi:hypothetical protein
MSLHMIGDSELTEYTDDNPGDNKETETEELDEVSILVPF